MKILDTLRSWFKQEEGGSRGREYIVALSLVAIATLVNLLAWPSGSTQDGHYFALVAAVLVSALYGGFGPGLFATALAGLSSSFFALSPQFSIRIADQQAATHMVVFLVEGVLLSLCAHMVRKHHKGEVSMTRWHGYLAIPLTIAAGTVAKLLLPGLARETPFAFNFTAVCICAWMGGLLPGIISVGLLAVVTQYLFLEPLYAGSGHVQAIRVGLFVVEGLLLVFLENSYAKVKLIATKATLRARALMAGALSREQDTTAIMAISRDTIWEWGLDTGEIVRTPSWQDVLSVALPPREEFTAWVERIHPEDRAATIEKLRGAIDEGRQELQYTYRLRDSRGKFLSVWDHAFIVRGSDWKALRVIGRSADITTNRVSEYGDPVSQDAAGGVGSEKRR